MRTSSAFGLRNVRLGFTQGVPCVYGSEPNSQVRRADARDMRKAGCAVRKHSPKNGTPHNACGVPMPLDGLSSKCLGQTSYAKNSSERVIGSTYSPSL